MKTDFFSFIIGLAVCTLTWAADTDQVRPPAVAGTWYPGDAKELETYLDGLLAGEAKDLQGPVRALISPHAGYRYSGAAAADGYRQVRGGTYSRVLVLGPAHRGRFHGLSIAAVDHYETPLGRMSLDLEAVNALRKSTLVSADPRAHRHEHGIEMQLPLLQRALQPGWRLVPVLVGDMHDGDYARAADLLRPLLGSDTLVVASSDFTHYGPRYDYAPFPHDADTPARIKALDRGALERILARDAVGLLDYQAETGITICGYRPIVLLLHLLGEDTQGHLLTQTSSGELTGDYRNSVSYLGILFTGRARSDGVVIPRETGLSREHLEQLHRIASAAVEVGARPRESGPMERLNRLLEGVPPELKTPSGAFVTLKKRGQLRGCIGYIQPRKPLYQAVARNGINAALHDRRFSPLSPGELNGLEVEVSVLTPPETVDSYLDFDLGEEGVILEKSGHSAVFLPEVAVEQGWDREQTLTHLSQKAGLPPDAWRQGASFKTFRSIKFSAPWRDGE